MKSPDALDGEDPPLEQGGGRRAYRIAGARHFGAVASRQPGARATVRTAVRLRVKAPVERVVVLRLAPVAHPEAGHRGQRPVVGHCSHDREARPAVGAVDERVTVAAVARIEELGEAFLAGRHIGRDERGGLSGPLALRDPESRFAPRLQLLGGHPLNAGQGRRLGRQPLEEPIDSPAVSLHLEQHSSLVVEDVTAEVQGAGQPVDERPEPHSLDHALDPGPHASLGRGGRLAHRLTAVSAPPSLPLNSTSSRSTW
jgi:hypothetical protein